MTLITLAATGLAFFLSGVQGFTPYSSRSRVASAWATKNAAALKASPDFVDPGDIAGFNKQNFGDPLHGYWGLESFELTFGMPLPLKEGVYEVILDKPMGIVFEETVPNAPKGVRVAEVLEGSNAAAAATPIGVGDELVAVTGVKVVGAKHERMLVPAQELDFDTIMSAIGSNEQKWGCPDVILQLKRAPSS